MHADRWQKVKQIYNSALELELGERESFLSEACAGDEDLRKEVERLLGRNADAEGFLEFPAMEVAAKALARNEKRRASDPVDSNLIGKTLSHFRILEKLGEGGMGEVFLAEDTNLNRRVAVKVLPDVFAGDAERLARLEREARLLASLNHPNIASIYGLERTDSCPLLVLELVEGETLAQRLAKGAIPVAETLEVCRQIAEGLEAAHEKGIVHRDLTPGNVKVTPEGQVKILDFGLAKALQDQANATVSPNISEVTRPGLILGTAAYMSPEQARGKSVDRRTDIWAFGCILYECLTGRRTFQGETVTDTLAAIINEDPDWEVLPQDAPAKVRIVLQRCLQKDLKLRYHDIADAWLEIETPMASASEAVSPPRRYSFKSAAAYGAVILLAGALIGLALMRYFQPAPGALVVTATIKVEPGHWLDGGRVSPPFGTERPTRTAMAISNDGRFMVYSAVKENPGPQDKPHLYLRRLDQLEAKPIAGTEGGVSPFLSPDDRWVGFWASGKLMKVSVDGGVPAALCDVSQPFGFSWGTDNEIVFASERERGLSRVSANGGEPETLTVPDKSKEELSHRLPYCLASGKGILFTILRHGWDLHPRVALMEPDTRKWRVLLEDAADARHVSIGHLVFLRQGTLMAVPFDLNRLECSGKPVPVVADVMQAMNAWNDWAFSCAGQFSVSDAGCLAYSSGGIFPDSEFSLVWVDHKGAAEIITPAKAPYLAPRLSPDGGRIAFTRWQLQSGIWVYDIARGTSSRLAADGKIACALWTSNGTRVLFNRAAASVNLFWVPVDASSPMEQLTTGGYQQWPASLSPDGVTLAYVESGGEAESHDIHALDLRTRRVTPLLNSRFSERCPDFSPDGRWLAYSSNESGRSEVYVRPYPGAAGRWQVSQEGGMENAWSRDGRRLFYRWRGQVWVVDIRTDQGFRAGKPRMLFENEAYFEGTPIRTFDVSLDDQRFLMEKMEEMKSQPVTEMILVQNWFEELKRLVSAGRN